MKKTRKVLLAFSGGLDTSFCAKYLAKEKGLEVHSAIVNTGGFSSKELEKISLRALHLGVKSHKVLEETIPFYKDIIRYLIYGNVLRNNTYPLSVSAERVHQAIALAKYAKEIGADYIAHGSTGAGNDQIRFDLIFQLVAPELEILTPVRTLQLTRQEEIQYLAKHGLDLDWKKARYSVNKGLWGTSIGGVETLTSHLPLPEEAWPSPLRAKTPRKVTLSFFKGELIALDHVEMHPVKAIQQLEMLASPYAIGRDIHVGDTIIGIKGRVGFEAAAAIITIKAHHLLEKHTLSKWQQHWKHQIGEWYGMFLHEARYLDPVMRNIECFLEDSQSTVTGKVYVLLHPYRFELLGIEAPGDLMQSSFGKYGETHDRWSGRDVQGFTKILANPMQIINQINQEK